MWKSAAGQQVKIQNASADDDWDTDPDFVNDVSEKEQRKGAKTIEGSVKPKDSIDVSQLRNQVVTKNEETTKKEYLAKPNFSTGYGGKFGVQTDRMDKSAVGFDHVEAPKADHSSIPKYQKPAVVSAPASSIKNKFEQIAAVDAERAQQEKIAAERAARQEKERQQREEAKRIQEEKEKQARAQREKEERLMREQQEAEQAAIQQHEQQQYEQQQEQQYEEQAVEQAYEEQPQQTYETGYEEQPQEQQTGGYTATAVYEYEAGGDDELPFKEGEIIYNIEMIDEGWWRGECNGRYGLFPANYVQLNQ